MLSKDIWEGHPCCVFAASKEFVTQTPNTYAALLKAIIDATAFATKAENRKQIAEAIAPANYLNQPVTVVEQVLTGTFADGLGNVKNGAEPHRLRSVPLGVVRGLDHDPDEALGSDQGRRRLRRAWRKQVFLATDTDQADEGGRADAADRHVEDASWSWARPSIRRSPRTTSRASPSSGRRDECCRAACIRCRSTAALRTPTPDRSELDAMGSQRLTAPLAAGGGAP